MSLGVNVTVNEKINLSVIALDCRYQCHDIPEAELVLDAGETVTGDFKILDEAEFQPGEAIDLKLNYGPGAGTSVFKGLITGVRLRANAQGAQLVLQCHGDAIKLVEPRLTRRFPEKQSDSSIIAGLISDAGVQPNKATDTKLEHGQMMVFDESAWSFIKRRAEANGLLVMPSVDGLTVAAPADLGGQEIKPEIRLDHLVAVDLVLDNTSVLDPDKLKAGSWNHQEQELVNSTTTASSLAPALAYSASEAAKAMGWAGGGQYQPVQAQSLQVKELDALCRAEVLYRDLDRLQGQLTCPGRADIKPGDKITLQKTGKPFSHSYLVTGIRQKVDAHGWQTVIDIGLPLTRTGFFGGHQRGNGAVHSLLTGLVEDDYKEKEVGRAKLYRIKVKLPILGGKDNIVWARLSAPFASESAGLFLPPRKGDEVVVGWFGPHSVEPVILGAMHNKNSVAPVEYQESMQRGLVYDPKKLSWLFTDDKGKLSHNVTIKGDEYETSIASGKVSMTLKKQSLAVDSNIAITSGGTLDLKATGNCTIAGKAVEVQ